MRILLALLLLITWLPAIDISVDSDFAMDEESVLIFSYAELMAKCTVTSGPAVDLKISGLSGDGSVHIAGSATGPWTTTIVNTTIFASGQYIRFIPNTDVQGNNIKIIEVRARNGVGAESSSQSVNVDIANLPDLITASNGIYNYAAPPLPDDPQVTEDVQHAFTFEQLQRTLAIAEADPQAWTVRITGKRHGTLWTAGGVPITVFPHDVPAPAALTDVAVRWQADSHVFTKPLEDPLEVLTLRAVNTVAPFDQTAEVLLRTPVLGVANPIPGGDPTTLGALAPIVVYKNRINTITHAQLCALRSGTNDYDRQGGFGFNLNGPAGAGTKIKEYDASGAYIGGGTMFGRTLYGIDVDWSMQVVLPDSISTGLVTVGAVDLWVITSAGASAEVPVTFDVRNPPHGGGDGDALDGGGGGGCGAGGAVAGLLMLLCCALGRPRRR